MTHTRKRLTSLTTAVFGSVMVFVLPAVAWAQKGCDKSAGLCNPLGFDSIQEFVQKVIEIIVMISLPVIAFFIVFTGFQFLMAQGNQDKLGNAKRMLLYVVLGAILILGAWALAQLIGGTIDEIRTG